jgi:hypothetical protein
MFTHPWTEIEERIDQSIEMMDESAIKFSNMRIKGDARPVVLQKEDQATAIVADMRRLKDMFYMFHRANRNKWYGTAGACLIIMQQLIDEIGEINLLSCQDFWRRFNESH